MNSEILRRIEKAPDGLTADLSCTLGERNLVRLVLNAVQTLDGVRLRAEESRVPGCRRQMLLTLLTYCYAAKFYGSRDIEWAMGNDSTVRYICARTTPDWRLLRRFRRHNRDLVAQCLEDVFKQAWALQFDLGVVDYPGYAWFEENFVVRVRNQVLERLDLAALMDGAESD